jgi:hypothetical protein
LENTLSNNFPGTILIINLGIKDEKSFLRFETVHHEPNTSLSSSSSSSSSSFSNTPILTLGVLLRLIDDYLYISTSKANIKEFVTQLSKKFEENGIEINHSKTKSNFSLQTFSLNDEMKYIQWCGYTIDTKYLQILRDYTRVSDISERSSRYNTKEGLNLLSSIKK